MFHLGFKDEEKLEEIWEILLEEEKQKLQLLFHAIDGVAEKLGVAVNVSKTKNMAISNSPLLNCKDKTSD